MTWMQILSIACFVAALVIFVAVLESQMGWYRRRREHTESVEVSEPRRVEPKPEPIDSAPSEGIGLVYDPSDPPVQMTLNEDSTKTYLCTCHGNIVKPGETVVMWPVGHGSPAKHLLCATAMQTLAVDSDG